MAKNVNVLIKDVSFNYVHVFEPDEKGRYTVQVRIRKDNPAIPTLIVAAKEAVANGIDRYGRNFGECAEAKAATRGDIKGLLKDGDEKHPGETDYAGMFFFSASTAKQPQVVRRSDNGIPGFLPVIDEDGFQSTDKGQISVAVYPRHPDMMNNGISYAINAILVEEKGPRTFGTPSAESIFGEDDDDLPM